MSDRILLESGSVVLEEDGSALLLERVAVVTPTSGRFQQYREYLEDPTVELTDDDEEAIAAAVLLLL